MASCFVIRRCVSATFYSIRTDGKEQPCVIAFKNKNNARRMLKFINQTSVQKQKLVIESIPTRFLIDTCTTTALNLSIYEEDKMYTAVDEPTDDIRYNFEMKYKY